MSRSERPLGSLGRRIRWSLASGGAALTASVVGYLLLSRFVEPREYGRVSVILAVWGLAGTALDWCGGVMVRFGPVELVERGSLASTLGTRLLFAAPVLPLLLVGLPLYLGRGRGWSAELVGLTVAYLVAYCAHNALYWSAIAAQRFEAMTAAGIVQKSAPLGAVVAGLVLGVRTNAEHLLAATLIGTAGAALILLVALRDVAGVGRPSRELWSRMWRYNLPTLIGTPASAAIAWLDPLLLQHWASHADVGRHQLAAPTFTIFARLGSSLNNVIGPELVRAGARGDATPLCHYRDREQPRLALALGLVAFAGALLAAPVVRAVLPESYRLTGDLVAILTAGGGFVLAFSTLQPLVTATDSVWSLQVATMLQAATGVALTVALAPRWGAVGVALSSVIAWAVAYTSLVLLLRRLIALSATTLAPLVALGGLVALVLTTRLPELVRLGGALALLGGAAVTARPLRLLKPAKSAPRVEEAPCIAAEPARAEAGESRS
jgi:O-antigen/teichoic acid export membrane protein